MRNRINFSIKIIALGIFISISSVLSAQFNEYSYLREIETSNELWNKVTLPIPVIDHLESNYSDIRIYTVTNTDTIEEPYFLEIRESQTQKKAITFDLINQVKDASGYYYTFSFQSPEYLNELTLDFDLKNFDTYINLYGSEDGEKWYTIKENHRIVSISNADVSYSYSSLTFPKANYKHLKLKVAGAKDLKFRNASILLNKTEKATLNKIEIQKSETSVNKKRKTTIIDWETPFSSPVSSLEIKVNESLDYFRTVSISYAHDSIMKNDSMHYYYKHLYRGTISSLEKSVFEFFPTVLKKLKITINNYDNQPLNIDQIVVKSNAIQLTARFKNKGIHYLAYGREYDSKPKYDLVNFKNTIPEHMNRAAVGSEFFNESSIKETEPQPKPIFENKIWLWALMFIVILILGSFTFKMMREKPE